jgi:hypothetical protein
MTHQTCIKLCCINVCMSRRSLAHFVTISNGLFAFEDLDVR